MSAEPADRPADTDGRKLPFGGQPLFRVRKHEWAVAALKVARRTLVKSDSEKTLKSKNCRLLRAHQTEGNFFGAGDPSRAEQVSSAVNGAGHGRALTSRARAAHAVSELEAGLWQRSSLSGCAALQRARIKVMALEASGRL